MFLNLPKRRKAPMDNSQSSDVFSADSEGDRNAVTIMDKESYESTITNTKDLLTKNLQNEITKSTFSTYFEAVLENCNTCIFQSLDLIIGLLDNPDSQLSNLQFFMENTVCLLQMLSGFIKNVIESVSMPCCTMKTFPTTTGRIIMAIFSHCKDSESIYGHNLKCVENQLKELFRTCHELQLTYLMILEKHFIFDLSEKDELDILVEALEINLKIGEIVQSLDVKTMAEQWKAYTMICEKHSNNLKDTHVYYNCTEILCAMIKSNIKIAVEIEQDEKITLRSLKVANFTIKILLKVCNIFKLATEKNYRHIIDLLLYVYLNNCAYLELTGDKSPQFANQMNVNVLNPADSLLKELLLDEHFCNCVLKFDVDSLKKDDELLGYILLLVSVIESVLQNNYDCIILKQKLIESIFRFLPYGHIWFNMGLKFKTVAKAGHQTYGLYEHLLTHTLALATTLNAEEFVTLEQKMYEALLSTNCYNAIFSSNLWILLVRYSHLHNRQFAFGQLVSLCKVYQRLENNKLFHKSPQQVHLTYTISRCFYSLQDEDKSRVFKQFSIQDDNNRGLWTALQVRHLPAESQYDAEESILEVLNEKFRNLFASGFKTCEEIDNLISTIKLASTCRFSDDLHPIEEFVVTAWTKACPINNKFILSKGDLDRGAVWYLEYVEALVLLTDSMKHLFRRSANLVKVLHVVSPMIQKGNSELKLVLMNLLCKIALCLVQDENKHLAESLLEQSFKHLLLDTNQAMRSKFFNVLRKYIPNKNIYNIILNVSREENTLRETWNYFIKYGKLGNVNINLKEQLRSTLEFKYCHKCVESKHVIELSDGSVRTNKSNSNHFDLVDIDSLFDNESDSEPACKKVKLNTNDALEIVARLENDTTLLGNVKENVFTFDDKVRIRNVCEKLLNIIE